MTSMKCIPNKSESALSCGFAGLNAEDTDVGDGCASVARSDAKQYEQVNVLIALPTG
jgi:hypothetical protein